MISLNLANRMALVKGTLQTENEKKNQINRELATNQQRVWEKYCKITWELKTNDKAKINEKLSKEEIKLREKELEQEDERIKIEQAKSKRKDKLLEKYLDGKIDDKTFLEMLKLI